MAAGKSALSLLVDPAFRRLLPSIEVCFLGLFIHIVACSWVMAELTDSATMVALVTTITSLPPVLLSLLAGGLADVLDRRRVMILSQIFMFLVSLVLVGISFVFGPLRSVSMGLRIFAGVITGVVFMIVQNLMGPSSLVFGFPPVLSVLIPIAICLLIGMALLRRAA